MLRSVMGNWACDFPVEGLRGVFHVKRIIGEGEWEVTVRERVGGVGLLKV